MTDLRDPWRDLLARRRALASSLAPYGEMLERWAAWTPSRRAPGWSAPRCRETWSRGVPLTAETPPPLDAGDLEDLLGGAMEEVAAVDPARAPALQPLAGAWDGGAIGPPPLLPPRDGPGAGRGEAPSGLAAHAGAFPSHAPLAPLLG